MKPSETLILNREQTLRIVMAHRATNPRVFGSVLRGEYTEQSDIDLLVDPLRVRLYWTWVAYRLTLKIC